MIPEGYVEYKRREFCKDVKCPVEEELNKQTEGSPAYEADPSKMHGSRLPLILGSSHWLIEKGNLILKQERLTT